MQNGTCITNNSWCQQLCEKEHNPLESANKISCYRTRNFEPNPSYTKVDGLGKGEEVTSHCVAHTNRPPIEKVI